jgi:hypothetical protein
VKKTAPPAPYPTASAPSGAPGTAIAPPGVNPLAPHVPASGRPLRDKHGRLLPGQSANRHGRPKGVAALARSIQDEVGIDALREYAVRIWRNVTPVTDEAGNEVTDEHGNVLLKQGHYSHAESWQAFQWLSDRGYGKPVVAIDMRAMIQEESARDADDGPDLDPNVDGEDLLRFSELLARVVKGSAKKAPRVIDAQAEEQNAYTCEEVTEDE